MKGKLKITTKCVPCLLERIRYQSELRDKDYGPPIIKECLNIISQNYSSDICSAVLATEIHKKCHEMLGFDPYAEIKEQSNRVALNILPRARNYLERFQRTDERFQAAVLISIIGNIMDFGINTKWKDPEALKTNFKSLLEEGLGCDDLPKIRKYIRPESRMIYLTDNCGEIVLDTLLLEELASRGCRVVLVVKGEPVLTDATLKDAEELELDKIVWKVLTTGGFAVGIDLDNIPLELENEIINCDIIIAKGMANFEALSERIVKPTAFLMRTKCQPVAEALGVPAHINAAKLILPE